MARHDQKQSDRKPWVCLRCSEGECGNCVDVVRAVYADDLICGCKAPNHLGEPSANQVEDPFTGTVHGPAATITDDGKVNVDPEFKQAFRELFDGTKSEGLH